MSVIRKYPFIDDVINKLSVDQKKTLLNVMNTAGNNVEASLLNMPEKGIKPVLFKLDEANIKTGILIYLDDIPVTLIAYHRFQDVLLFELHPESTSYNKVNEYCDINELRRLLTVGEAVSAGEIDSGLASEDQVLAANGEGGAVWKDVMDVITPETVEEGDAIQLFGFDANGQLVKDNIPEGITVDQTVIEDSENAVAGGAVYDEITPMKADIEQKANKDGNYQTMTVGLANNFDSKLTENDQSAYNFRPTASMGSVELEVGSPCKVKKIVGGTIAYNQLVNNGNFATNSLTGFSTVRATTTISNGVATTACSEANGYIEYEYKTITGHKYLGIVTVKCNQTFTNSGVMVYLYYNSYQGYVRSNKIDSTSYTTVALMFSETNSSNNQVLRIVHPAYDSGGTSFSSKNWQFIDLTAMFGATIADYIYTLETTTPGAGVAWFKRYFPNTYYAYNTGTLVSVKTQGKKIVKFNQWDEQWEEGVYNTSTGEKAPYSNRIRSKNFIPVIPNTQYYFKCPASPLYLSVLFYDANYNYIDWLVATNNVKTTPANCRYIAFGVSGGDISNYNNDICINFHYDGERDGEYEPYDSETYAMEDAELRGIPKLDSNNNLVFDGDEYNSDGTENVRYGIVDLGSLDWTYDSTYTRFRSSGINSLVKRPASEETPNAIACGYKTYSNNSAWNGNIAFSFWIDTAGGIYLTNSNYTDAATFKTALNGVYLVYELATPTTDNLDPFAETQSCDNWGTEQFLAPVSDTRPCEVPVGHDTDYLPDLKAKLESAPTTPSEDGYYVLEHDDSAEGNPNLYAALGTALAALGYVKLSDITGYDATKTQTLKNVEGTLTWVDDE